MPLKKLKKEKFATVKLTLKKIARKIKENYSLQKLTLRKINSCKLWVNLFLMWTNYIFMLWCTPLKVNFQSLTNIFHCYYNCCSVICYFPLIIGFHRVWKKELVKLRFILLAEMIDVVKQNSITEWYRDMDCCIW